MSSAQVRPAGVEAPSGPIHESHSFAAHLKTLERNDSAAHALRKFHRRRMGRAAEGRLFRQHLADHRTGDLPDPALAGRGRRARDRRGARRGRSLGPNRGGGAGPHLEPHRRPHGAISTVPRGGRDLRQRQADPRDQPRGHAARGRSLPLLRELHPGAGRLARRTRRRHRGLSLPRAARRRGADHSLELPGADGGLEGRSGARRGQRDRAQARGTDSVVDAGPRRAHPGHPAPGRAQHRQWIRPRGRQAAGIESAHRQDRLHRRDHHRPAHHAVRVGEHHPGDARARRQVAEHLLRGRDARGR